MRPIANLIWFLICGFLNGLSWFAAGLLWCITIVGIPIGKQCFKLAGLSFFPFGKEIVYEDTGSLSLIANILWLLISGIPLALEMAASGVLLCCTIIGIPFGLQQFKLAKLALMPFGTRVERVHVF